MSNEHLTSIIHEVWTDEHMRSGMLWPGRVTLHVKWVPERDCYECLLASHDQYLYSYTIINPPPLGWGKSLAQYMDSQMTALKQIHFAQQAAERGGYY